MQVYILVRNEFCIHEYDDYDNVEVFLHEEKAQQLCDFLNKEQGNSSPYSGVRYTIEEYEVTV